MHSHTASNAHGGTPLPSTPEFDAIRELIVRELRAEQLSKAEQDSLMQVVGDALWERATLALMKSAPPELLIEIGDEGNDPRNVAQVAHITERILQVIPNAQDILANAIREGLRDYQEYLDVELANTRKQP